MSRLPLIIGHRGASALAPENTMAAFRRAIAHGADGIEFDVRLSRDGSPVVIHDASLRRTTGDRRNVCEVNEAELRQLDNGSWFEGGTKDDKFYGETIPSLAEVFELYERNDGKLYLEMKPDPHNGRELAECVARHVKESPLRERVVVECFDHSLILKVKQLEPEIRTAALFEPRISQAGILLGRNLAAIAKEFAADEIALHHRLASPRQISKALRLDQAVVVWTVDDPGWVTKARANKVSALITNNPAILLERRHTFEV